MGELLWTPSRGRVNSSNMVAFLQFVNKRYGVRLESYRDLYKWSIEAIPNFWGAMWEYAGIRSSKGYDQVVDDLANFPGAKWFVGAQLNFAENLLRFKDERTAFVFRGETRKTDHVTYAELYDRIARLAVSLREMGVRRGDRVCAYMPNIVQTTTAMLAATSLGALWSSCGAELGPMAVLDRFAQIEPKVLFTADGYFYKNQVFDTISNAQKVVDGIPSIEKVVVASYVDSESTAEHIPGAVPFDQFLSAKSQLILNLSNCPSTIRFT